MMRANLGLILCLAGILFGIYVGVWWAFIGGIVDVIIQIRAPELSALAVAIGVAKIVFAIPIGWVTAFACIIPGYIFAFGVEQ